MNHSNQKTTGFTLVEAMIAFGVVMLIGLAIAQMMSQTGKMQTRTDVLSNAHMIKQYLTDVLSNTNAWKFTLEDPGNITFSCFQNGTDCSLPPPNNPNRNFRMRDPSNGVLYDALNSVNGFTRGGAPCSNYPSAACPFRVELTWKAYCPPPTALSPSGPPQCFPPDVSIEVSGKVIYSPGNNQELKTPFNPENYRILLMKNAPQPPVP
jgi:type II secretory pathway pseudopilin PulG